MSADRIAVSPGPFFTAEEYNSNLSSGDQTTFTYEGTREEMVSQRLVERVTEDGKFTCRKFFWKLGRTEIVQLSDGVLHEVADFEIVDPYEVLRTPQPPHIDPATGLPKDSENKTAPACR
jgi:hypothetical protein